MARKRSSSIPPNETYDSDNGFVEDAPRSKKPKTNKKGKVVRSVKGAGDGVGKSVDVGEGQVGKDGEVFWELSGKRRIGIQEFKGNRMINIREYYEKDGEMLPGKKGISLPIDQFNTIIHLLPQLEAALAEKGEKIGRPNYSGAAGAADAVMEEDEDGGEDEPSVKAKKNFEETSDEE